MNRSFPMTCPTEIEDIIHEAAAGLRAYFTVQAGGEHKNDPGELVSLVLARLEHAIQNFGEAKPETARPHHP